MNRVTPLVLWWMLGTTGLLQAQVVDPVVEFWTGALFPTHKVFFYRGVQTVQVGGVPWYSGPVIESVAVLADTVQPRWLWSYGRSDTSRFAGFNFQIPPRPIYSLLQDPRFPAGLYTVGFPFLDAFSAQNVYDFVISADTSAWIGAPQVYDLAGLVQQTAPYLALMLDPMGTYPPQVLDTLWVDSTRTVIQLIAEGPDPNVTFPAFCDIGFVRPPDRYHIVVQDTVHMGDGSRMWLQLDRILWLLPGCFVVKDSVHRTLTPAVTAKRAQSQTVTTSIVLENATRVAEPATRLTVPPRWVPVDAQGRAWRVVHPAGVQSLTVLDVLGRRMLYTRGNRVVLPRGGLYVVRVRLNNGTVYTWKGIAVR